MKKRQTRVLVALGVFGVLGVAGCELAVDFDRTKIDSGTFDASMGETSTVDAPVTMDSATDAQGDGTVTGDGATTDASDASVSDAGFDADFDADDGSDAADE